MGAGKAWWEVGCEIHGRRDFHTTVKTVKVGGPSCKKEKHSGCPLCRKERNRANVGKSDDK